MSIKKANEFYNQLNASQKKFVDEKTISSTMSIEKWIGFLAKAAAYDEYGNKARKSMNTKTIVFFRSWVYFHIYHLCIYLLGGHHDPVFCSCFSFNIKKRKNSPERSQQLLTIVFFPLLDILSKKAGNEAKLSAQLDFRIPSKAQERKKYEANGRKIQEYAQNFIMAKLMLQDGSKLEFVISDNFIEQSYWKTSASGKRKHKTKTKTVHGYS